LKDLKEKYVDLLKQQEKTLLDLKEFEKELQSFDFICRTYEDKLKYVCQKLKEKCEEKSLSKQEIAFEDLIISGTDRSKVASMIYIIYKNNGKGIGFSEGRPNEINLKSCCECIKEGLKAYFVHEAIESEVVIQLEAEAPSSKTLKASKPKNYKPKIMTNSESKTLKIQILKRPEPISQVLKNQVSVVSKPKVQRRKTIVASWDSKPKVAKPKVLNEQKPLNFKHKAQNKKSKNFSTNLKGPIKIWVPKSKILDAADMLKRNGKAKFMVPGQWLFTTHDRRKVYVLNPNNERGRNSRIWRKPD